MDEKFQRSERGFSTVELVMVVVGLAILSTIAVMSFNSLEMTKADSQASELVDILQEARQRAITQRRTMRVEINATDKVIRLINEKDKRDDASDDVEIRKVSYVEGKVFIGNAEPSGMTSGPSELTPVPVISFKSSSHPLSNGDNVATLRFFSNGKVKDAGNDAIGTGSIVTGATILVWSKNPNDASASSTTANILRAVTITNSGLIRMRKCSKDSSGNWSNWS